MTRSEERLAELLHDTTPEPVRDVSYDDVVGRVRARRRTVRAFAVTGTAVAAVAALVAVAALSGARSTSTGPARTASPNPTATSEPSPQPPDGTIAYQGIWVKVPSGWTVRPVPLCGFSPDHTVAVQRGVRIVAPCPYVPAPLKVPSTLTVTSLYTWNTSGGWDGTRIDWHGQPVWRSEQSYRTAEEVTLALPWLNAVVTATAPTRAEALHLLDAVRPHPADEMDVPTEADAVEVSFNFSFMSPVVSAFRAHVTRPGDVAALLADLAAGDPVQPAAACNADGADRTAELTVRQGRAFRTFLARFDTCGQVVGGNGHATRVGGRLEADVSRLAKPVLIHLGNSTCTSGGGGDPDGQAGAPTALAALQRFLDGKPAGFPSKASAFVQVDEGIFLSEHTQVAVIHQQSPDDGYVVQFDSNCG